MRTILTLGLIGFCGVCFGQDVEDGLDIRAKADVNIRFDRMVIFDRAGGAARELRMVEGVVLEMEPVPGDPRKKVLAQGAFDRLFSRDFVGKSQSRWNARLDDQIHRDARGYELKAEDVRKLRVAAKGDAKRLSDRIDSARREFESIRMDPDKADQFLAQTLRPMRLELQNAAYRTGSLYQKVLRRMIIVKHSSDGTNGGEADSLPEDSGDETD